MDTKHGHNRRNKRSSEYTAWANMLARCRPGRHDADRYWDRGVEVCERWDPRKGGSFSNFLLDMGQKPGPEYSLDKDGIIPGNLIYGPGLCRWATPSEQMTARRNTVWLTHQDERLSVQQWSIRSGVPRSTLERRLKLGWSISAALTTPVDRTAGRLKTRSSVTYNGVTKSISEWSNDTGIPKDTLSWRLRNGWDVAKALTALPAKSSYD
jgi:hypothetical protein